MPMAKSCAPVKERIINSVDELLALTADTEKRWKFNDDDIGRAWFRGASEETMAAGSS